ncbi:MAG: hypothetical protein LC722_07035 [Actinobacteria bacterium]|nr:hypothetical protein [Actinomycetota bacterium]
MAHPHGPIEPRRQGFMAARVIALVEHPADAPDDGEPRASGRRQPPKDQASLLS